MGIFHGVRGAAALTAVLAINLVAASSASAAVGGIAITGFEPGPPGTAFAAPAPPPAPLSTVFFNPNHSGEFTLRASAVEGATFLSVAFPTPGAGWNAPGTVVGTNLPAYAFHYSFAAGATPSTSMTVDGYTIGRNLLSTPLAFAPDGDAPTGGSIAYDGGRPLTSFNVAFTAGADAKSGLRDWHLERSEAELIPAGPGMPPVCGAFAPWHGVAGPKPASPWFDPEMWAGHCFRYRLVTSDRVGNVSMYDSQNVASTLLPPPPPLPHTGTAGNDHVGGTSGDDRLDGGAGGDQLAGAGGDDTVIAGAGNDHASGGAGDDELDGGGGNDHLNGDSGSDTLDGDSGADTENGGAGNDQMEGDGGNDRLSGNNGNDSIDGGPGRDILKGGAGNDVIDAEDGHRGDKVNCGSGNDWVTADKGDQVASNCEHFTHDSSQQDEGDSAARRVTICHATGSATTPYETITIATSALAGHATHPDDLIPAPAGGCARAKLPPRPEANAELCASDTAVTMLAVRPGAIDLASCRGNHVELATDPWVRSAVDGIAPERFGVGYGAHSVTLSSGRKVSWTTDDLHALESMTVTSGDHSVTLTALGAPAWGFAPAPKTVATDLTHADLRDLQQALIACKGAVTAPIACA